MALGIGAGGTIIQNIEPDTNDPRIWDVASSKILNVQIIDSRTFKLVTGLPPPPSPITAETYAQMGLPFFQLWRDEQRTADIESQWHNIMGPVEVASAKLKQKQKASSADTQAAAVEQNETGTWGLLASGAWGKLTNEAEIENEHDEEGNERVAAAADVGESIIGKSRGIFKERGKFHFPTILLDVDDTVPVFKSVLELDSDDHDDEELGLLDD